MKTFADYTFLSRGQTVKHLLFLKFLGIFEQNLNSDKQSLSVQKNSRNLKCVYFTIWKTFKLLLPESGSWKYMILKFYSKYLWNYPRYPFGIQLVGLREGPLFV